ncbi:phage tail protein I [Moraxella sp. ZY210820]|uniref:phage tail protein I n=1 Tax=unclassified Moraxella TaxID=2685852 RepID=UPI00273132C3|nr:phage tail protein I [Moraxella sp. ZY210820]WLF84496.1 phage tail protein I [Moraxella sp. ZY210820]
MSKYRSLLPVNSTQLERDLEYIGVKIERLPVPFVALSRIDECPEAYLPWLAWSHRVEYWNPDWTIEQKRQAIHSAKDFNAGRGTQGSLQALINTVTTDYRITSWHQMKPKGQPYTFIVAVDKSQMLTVDELATLHTAIDATKSQRDLYSIDAQVKSQATLNVGGQITAGEIIYLSEKR